MNGWRQTGHRDDDIWPAHVAQARCPHGMNAVSRSRSRQMGHSLAAPGSAGGGAARARSIAHRRRYALLCQMRGASVLMRRRVGALFSAG